MFTKIIGFLVTCYLLLVTSAAPVFAQNVATPAATLPPVISPTSPAYTDLYVHNMFHTFSCLTIGASIIGQPCVTYQLQKNAQGVLQSVPALAAVDTSGGVMGTMTSLVATLFANRPVRTIDYMASVIPSLGVVKEAHAQVAGSGNTVLSPVISLWRVSRNISYLVMIVIFIVIGLMVMFRQKINPQTVITAQAAIPGLVVGLVLITFSYFLAGLIVDFSFIGIDLVGYYFQTAQQNQDPLQISQELQDKNVLSLLPKFLNAIKREDVDAALNTVWDQIKNKDFEIDKIINPTYLDAEKIIRAFVGTAAYQFGSAAGPALGQLAGGGACALGAATTVITMPAFWAVAPLCIKMGEAAGTFLLPGALGALGFANPPLVVSYVVTFAIIFVMLYVIGKLFLRLLNCYLSVVFYTLTAPFHFLIAALPGRQGVATDWIKGLLGNVLAFPAVAAGIYFSAYLLGSSVAPLPGTLSGAQGQLDIFSKGNTLPLLGGLDLSFLRVLLAFGAFVALPAIPDVINKAIGVQGGGIMGLFNQEVQGNIGAGRGQQAQFARGLGALGTDVSNYRKKWYEDPYEPRGVGARIGAMAANAKPRRAALKETLLGGLRYIATGQEVAETERPSVYPADYDRNGVKLK